MITYRVRGVTVLHSILIAGVAAGLFWLWIAAHFSLRLAGTPVTHARYAVYMGVIMAALGLDLLISKIHDTDLLQLDLIGVLKLSFRQTLTVLVVLLLFLVAQKDTAISRVFLFSFIPVLYGALTALKVSPCILISCGPICLCSLIAASPRPLPVNSTLSSSLPSIPLN